MLLQNDYLFSLRKNKKGYWSSQRTRQKQTGSKHRGVSTFMDKAKIQKPATTKTYLAPNRGA
jgi:hypothetical protein